jgi:hypothetical protein
MRALAPGVEFESTLSKLTALHFTVKLPRTIKYIIPRNSRLSTLLKKFPSDLIKGNE